MSQSKQSAGRRLSTITIDQVIAGSSNVLIAIVAARVLGVESFGLFGIVFIIYVTSQGVSRALVSEPLLVHPVEAQERPGDVIGAAGVLGLGVGIVVCLSGLLAGIWDGGLGRALLVMGICMPLLVLQDLGRYLGFATHRPSMSLTLDIVWLVLMVAAIGVMLAAHADSLTWFIAAWAGSGAVAGLYLLWRYRRHSIRPSLSWVRETWMFSWRYLLSYAATQGSTLIASIGILAISGLRALGSVRGTLLLMSPIVTFQAASIAAGVAEVSRLPTEGDHLRKHVTKTTALTTVVAMLTMLVLLFLPDELGKMVLGETWEPTKPLLLPASVQMILLALISGPRSAMLGMRAVKITVRIDVVSTIIALGATIIGVVVADAFGAFWALAIGQAIIAITWWIVYRGYTAKMRHASVIEEPEVSQVPPSQVAGS